MYSDGDVFFIRFVYIFLNVVNIFVFIFVGNRLQHCKTNKTYWKNAFWIILSYSILMGLRFGRLIDYNIYFERYQDIGKNFIDSEYEFTFKVLCWCFYKLGLSYKVFIFYELGILLLK